jgi:cyclin C
MADIPRDNLGGAAADFLGLDTSKLGECEFYMISELNSQLIVHQPYRTLTALQTDMYLTTEEVALAWSVINDHYMTDLPLLYPPHIIGVTAILLALVLKPNGSASSGGSAGAGGQGGGTNTAMKAGTAALAQAQIQAVMSANNGHSGAPGTTQTSPTVSGGAGSSQPAPAWPKDKGADKAAVKVSRFAGWLADSNIDIEAVVDCTQELITFYEGHEQYSDKLAREQINRFVKARGLDK